ncbi:TetR family transcriptional regulator [Allosphingosinicella flava]|uniref:TetR family transcriptional regulator n=1 Tax=Allosphingosinicella flava TaxID=2771430 RepID=A0A7T2GK71_9SPHN|nr:TetR/AcrR family transcriptional regulator [Sphingosinicella flava]QPQ55307.1 TetR family transcriptional regulator [Sphingosinicella flava]
MARPQSPDYDKRREAIVATAAKLFARRGFQGASVADLAEACSTSKSLVYHYFPSKEDILFEVMSSHLEQLVTAADDAMLGAPKPRDKLHDIALAFMRLYVTAQAEHKVLLNELDNLPPDRRNEIVSKQRRIIAIVEEQIAEIRPDVSAAGTLTLPLTMLFFGMINWSHTWFRAEGPVSAERLADLAMEIMLHGLEGMSAT